MNFEKTTYLEKFLLDKNLTKLTQTLNKPNLFEAAGLVSQEIRHSNFLAYLFNPYESHGMGELFFKRFLVEIAQKFPKEISAVDVLLEDFSDINVKREWRHIDIFIEWKLKDKHYVCAIENKIQQIDGKDQLKTYKEVVKKEYPKSEHIYLYLTPLGDDPSDVTASQEWRSISYEEDIISVLIGLLELEKENINKDVLTMLEHYIVLLRRNFVEDKAITDLCNLIYKTHKKAIDLIIKNKKTEFNTAFQEHINEISTKDEYEILIENDSRIIYLPKTLGEVLPKLDKPWHGGRYPILFFIDIKENTKEKFKLSCFACVGPYDNTSKRFELVKKLNDIFKNKEKKLTDTYTRVYSVSSDWYDNENLNNKDFLKEEIGKVTQNLYQNLNLIIDNVKKIIF